MLEVKNLTKIYETSGFKQKALDNISLNFRKNEFVSILGPSGSGKTTLLNIIGGLDKYTSGDLIINGVSTKNYKDKDWDSYRNHRVGFVFQSYNLIMHQSVLSNVELALTLSGIGKKERKKRAKDVLIKVGLKNHINKKPNQLSGGQMQRVAIARALVNDPDILLADEPTGALDTETSKQIMDLLKEIAVDKLVVMVTHNPELANLYSTRIVKVLDGKILEDTNPYDGTLEKEEKEVTKHKTKKTSMSFLTAFSLSLNNLMTKKGRTILTAFAGSIGIIGIALIMSLSNGIQMYINKVEQETLSSYPLTVSKESVDMSTLLVNMTNNKEKNEYNDNKIHSLNIMGDMFTLLTKEIKTNDLKSFKKYLEKSNINKYVTDIKYGYNITLNLYKYDDDIVKVNPTTIFDALGMNTSSISGAYSSYMSNYNVFIEMLDDEELNKKQYQLLDGKWPSNYDEMLLLVDKNDNVTDYTLYSIGLLDQNELQKQFMNMASRKDVSFEEKSFEYKDILNLKYKLVLESDYYKKVGNNWINMSNNKEYMKNILDNSIDVKIVGIIKPKDDTVITTGGVLYTHDLVEYYINKNNEKEIVKEQLENKDINVFTKLPFDSDINLTNEQMAYLKTLSQEQLAMYMQEYQNSKSSTYESNLQKLGIASLDDPQTINLYPIDFQSKENVVEIINKYNENLEEDEKIVYSDLLGIIMSSVKTIVDAISKVLIAFVSISLIVSSIMIAIITYISVIERTKEIGVLRAIGASKKDVSRVFNAETLIEGLISGVFGILATLLLNIPINIIIKKVVNIDNIAVLPLKGAILLIIISIVLTIIAGLIPAKMASKKDPVVALRSE